MPKTDFLSLTAHSRDFLRHTLDKASRLKAQLETTGRNDPVCAGKVLAMIFEKPSLRTRVSFETAMLQLGGAGLYISPNEIGLGKRESIPDVARVLSGMVNGIMARVFDHGHLSTLAQHASIPVINGLSDFLHPCQAMADLLTIEEHFGRLAGLTVAYVGDGNNVARSLLQACARFDLNFHMASPEGYRIDAATLSRIQAQNPGIRIVATTDPRAAAQGADVLYTDTWVSMGQEDEEKKRVPVFQPYQINAALLAAAAPEAVVMHCLPAHRGMEITDDIMDGPQSLVFQQAANRLHYQKGLLACIL